MKVLRLLAGNLAVFLVLMLLVGIGAELWARTRPRNWFITFDPLLGVRLKPGVEGLYRGLSFFHPNPAIETPVRINAQGMRGPERAIPKPPGVRRVIILGDSFVQALEVPYEDTVSARLEARGRDRGLPLEVVPMGVMGWGTAQELLWLREEGLEFDPDLVVLLFFVMNDQFDNSLVLNPNRGRPYYELRDGSLELALLPSQRSRIKYFVADYFRSARLWTEVAMNVGPVMAGIRAIGFTDWRPKPGAVDGYFDMLHDAFELTFALIEETRRTVEAAGSRFALAYHGSREMEGETTSDELVEGFCVRAQLDCLNLNPLLGDRPEYFVPGDGHWSPAGHALVADALWDPRIRDVAEGADASRDGR